MVIFFLSYCLLFNKITLNKGNVGTNHLNNRILLFVCNRKVIYYYYITLPSITITITITFGNFQSITITITGKSGYYYYNYILHITITPSLVPNFPSLFNWKFKREEFRITNLSELGLVSVTSLLTSPLFRILTSIDI